MSNRPSEERREGRLTSFRWQNGEIDSLPQAKIDFKHDNGKKSDLHLVVFFTLEEVLELRQGIDSVLTNLLRAQNKELEETRPLRLQAREAAAGA